jgi:hypothetical protein
MLDRQTGTTCSSSPSLWSGQKAATIVSAVVHTGISSCSHVGGQGVIRWSTRPVVGRIGGKITDLAGRRHREGVETRRVVS